MMRCVEFVEMMIVRMCVSRIDPDFVCPCECRSFETPVCRMLRAKSCVYDVWCDACDVSGLALCFVDRRRLVTRFQRILIDIAVGRVDPDLSPR
jgi:hypothetical protein